MTFYVQIHRCRGCWKLYGAEPGQAPTDWRCTCGNPIDYFYSEPAQRAEPMKDQTKQPRQPA